jgi:hypothetical protein
MIPTGTYNVTAEVTDNLGNKHSCFGIVNLTVGTATKNIAFSDLDVFPVSLSITASPGTISPGGDIVMTRSQLQSGYGMVVISAQLRSNGVNPDRSNVAVTFSSNNNAVGWLPNVKTNLTNSNGCTSIVLTMSQMAGCVDVSPSAWLTA